MPEQTESLPKRIIGSGIPDDILLLEPVESTLPEDQRHFLIYIPWNEKYLEKVPEEYREFFVEVLPYLRARTTDVHTAISMSYLVELLAKFSEPIDKRVVALALILHDSGWSRLSEGEIANSLGVTGLRLTDSAIAPKEKHAVESEKIARELLAKYPFHPTLTSDQIQLICKAVRYHDQPEAVAGAKIPMPLEVQLLVDLDHLWSFTHENFWQDTVRKGVEAKIYLKNLEQDLDSYFVTNAGKQKARELLADRAKEVV